VALGGDCIFSYRKHKRSILFQKKKIEIELEMKYYGGPGRIRTGDLLHVKQMS
jgi:hypothetical protein